MIGPILARDLRIARRRSGTLVLSLSFMALFVLVTAIAADGLPASLGPGLLWVAGLFAAMLAVEPLYQPDQESGALAQMHLAGVSGMSIAAAKALSFWLTALLPLIAITPLLSILFGMSGQQVTGLVAALILGSPALAAYTSLAGALLCGQRGVGVFAVLLIAPLSLPIIIFGVGAAENYVINGWAAVEFRILAGLSLIACALAIPAAAAALAANRDD